MDRLNPDEILRLFLALGVVLGAARVASELARRVGQPAVLGEIVAGLVLGSTVLGRVAPGVHEYLFPSRGAVAIGFHALTTVAIALFLFVAGLEIDLKTIARQSKAASTVGALGLAVPFVIGYATAYFAPSLVAVEDGLDRQIFALFFATALSVSALPVIAKTLMDLHLYRSDFGMVVMAAAIGNDLVGWIVFGVLLSQLQNPDAQGTAAGITVMMTIAFALGVLTLGRRALHSMLPWLQAHMSWPAGVLGFALTVTLIAGAVTEFIGIHAIFGAFLVGVALGDSSHLRERERDGIEEFVGSVFAPLFFGSICLHTDFVGAFDPLLCLVILVIACVGKVLGCGIGARWGGMSWREAWAVGFAMNARGAMEIVLGLLALQYGIVGEPMFVALVIMALVTSVFAGPVVQRLLGRKGPRRAADYFVRGAFLPRLAAGDRRAAIDELSRALAGSLGIAEREISDAVWSREELSPSGLGSGIAVPHARLKGLTAPRMAAGISAAGIDFHAHDRQSAKLVFLLLLPVEDDGAQLELLASLGRSFQVPEIRERALRASSSTELLALLRTDRPSTRSSTTVGSDSVH
ncbi:MAG: cation:proton antiporter [Planctomycetes bacterium]|nr:cation:proton antiporter [Planctomycetota bacterium]